MYYQKQNSPSSYNEHANLCKLPICLVYVHAWQLVLPHISLDKEQGQVSHKLYLNWHLEYLGASNHGLLRLDSKVELF